jgi:cell division septum initiation protein DivIVA
MMFRRAEVGVAAGGQAGEEAAGRARPAHARPNFMGDLNVLLEPGPTFRLAVRGYDRLQVDNYVAWTETELIAVRRECDHLLSRYEACGAQLEISKRLLAQSSSGRELSAVSERVGEILRLAADEAADLTAAGAQEAERTLAEARTEADARLRQAHEVKETAVAAGDELREEARRDRAEATALLDQAGRRAEELLRGAAEERHRLDTEAAQERERAAATMADRLAQEEERARVERESAAATWRGAVQEELDDVRGRRDQVRQALLHLSDQLDRALQDLTVTVSDEVVVMAAHPHAVGS